MKIAITRLAEKGEADAEICAKYGHTCKPVHPLRAELNASMVQQFVLAANAGEFDAVFFASAYSAKNAGRFLERGITKKCRIIAIGPETQRVLFELGIPAEILPEFYSKELVPYLGDWIEGKSIGLPRSNIPNQALIYAIEDAGAMAFEYRIYHLSPTAEPLDLKDCDAVLFTSAASFTLADMPDISGKTIIAIGKVTADSMRKKGIEPDYVGNGSVEGAIAQIPQK
ncbi:MAG TPA: uroporphyrinogen-III synthase [Methanocorpusculum sp.]|nr:uroporphyrinogen-III synthase [Methanocorpusculum sp.]